MSVQEAIQFNNHSIYLLENSFFTDATMCSCAAMEILQQYQRVEAQAALPQQGDTDYSIDQFMVFNHDHDRKRSSENSVLNEFIYDHGIFLPTDILDSTVITPVLIFNFALCHQLLARHCYNGSTSCNLLDRAKGLYKLAYNQQDNDDENVIFKFAMVNNIGVVHKNLGNYEGSKQCFEHLVSLMMVYVDFGVVESKHLQHIQDFWKNVLGNGSMAPAA